MVRKSSAVNTQSDTQQLDVAGAMVRLGSDRVLVETSVASLAVPGRAVRDRWARAGRLTLAQAETYDALARLDGRSVTLTSVVTFGPMAKSGVGRPAAVDDPMRAWRDATSVLGADASDVALSGEIGVSVSTIGNWRRAGLIPAKTKRAPRIERA